jgi:outer membrane protein OmpA-like peptidoglycan-associated protein
MPSGPRLPLLAVTLGLLSACSTASELRLRAAPLPLPLPVFPAADSDRDGVGDAYDACPMLPGVLSPVIVLNGCPPPGYYDDGLGPHDRDGDGVLDEADLCPEDPGPLAGRGCAVPPDADGDGVPNDTDACRNDPGPARNDARITGCPTAWVDGDRIRIVEPVRFASGSAQLLADSEPVLASVAAVLARRMDLTKLRIEGHTDSRGGAVMNRKLSLERATRVVGFLVDHGIVPARLAAVGVGPDNPIDADDTDEGRATNRRVEFHVVDVTPGTDSAPSVDSSHTPSADSSLGVTPNPAPSAVAPAAPPNPASAPAPAPRAPSPPTATFDSSGL